MTTAPAGAQSVVVPETTFSAGPVSLTVAATALLDADSTLLAYAVGNGVDSSLMVVNIDTGAIELGPISFSFGQVPTVAALGKDSALLVLRGDGESNNGRYAVVNALTGTVEAGPTVFHSGTTLYEYRVAVADASTVLIAYRDSQGLAGRFVVLDPRTGTIRLPETTFETGVNTFDVVALDADHVLIVYDHALPTDLPTFFTVIDVRTGAVTTPPVALLEPAYGIPRALRLSASEAIIVYRSWDNWGRFVRADATNGTTGEPTTYTVGAPWDFSVGATMLGSDALFIPFWRPAVRPRPGLTWSTT